VSEVEVDAATPVDAELEEWEIEQPCPPELYAAFEILQRGFNRLYKRLKEQQADETKPGE
jgi:hypothetical protein